jgi:hypothetical protein
MRSNVKRIKKESVMEDKILDDDDIIDLTDLLEEGQPPDEKEETKDSLQSAISSNEPDSFDLGKEISMEYDVSVEEIESGGESLDIDVSLSSNEEEALSQNKQPEEDVFTLEDTGEGLEIAFDKDTSTQDQEIDLSAKEDQIFSQDTPEDVVSVSESDFEGEVELSAPEPELENHEVFSAETQASGQEDETTDSSEAVREEPVIEEHAEEEIQSTEEAAVTEFSTDEVIQELRGEIPNMLEGIVRPLLAELTREIITATREQLPGIVEKVIREEIEKLKKLDS